MEKRVKKYEYKKVIQQMYVGCYGWEDVSEYSCNSSGVMGIEDRKVFKSDLSNYRLMGYPTRVIVRRERVKAADTAESLEPK